ncbi:hypothetical protein NQZ79_g3025 [Umbelopsis isabellina]|nr:hypothetical protein NQZ79_g3025 [Umbelopsis isabellina]
MAVSSIKAVRVNAVTNVETDTAFVEVEELLDRSVRCFHILGMKHLEHHLNGQAYIHCIRLQLREGTRICKNSGPISNRVQKLSTEAETRIKGFSSMYNLSQRANTAFSLASTVLFSILGLVAAISFLTGYGSPSSANVQVKNIRVVQSRYGPDYYDYGRKTSEFGVIKFDLDADLSDLFNWNTKQLFVSVVAEYETKTHNKNQVVIWDKIIRNKESAKLSLRNVPNKYALIDFSQKWRKQQAQLSLHWDVTPWVGTFQMGSSNTSTAMFTFPLVENQSGR